MVQKAQGTDLARAWDRIATGYDQFVTPSHARIAEEGLDRAGVEAGTRFLDVAAGTGALSLAAARRKATVTATDISPAMVDECLTRAEDEGLPIEGHVMDGHELDFDDDLFDVAGSQFGVMLFEAPSRAIGEMARVVRPGGKVFLTVFGDPSRVEFLRFFTEGVQAVRPDFEGLPKDPPPLPFQFRDPEVLRNAMQRSGLRDVRIHSLTEQMELRDGAHLWGWLLNSNPIPSMVLSRLGVTEKEHAPIKTKLSELVRERANGREVAELASPVHIAVGSV